MTAGFKLFHNPMSRSRIARWMLEEVGVPYEVEVLRFSKRDHKRESFLTVNPMGKLPTLVHGPVVVTEAAAICAYLADIVPELGLAPPPSERGPYYRWLFFGAGCLEPALTDRLFDRPPVKREGALGYGSYEETIGALAWRLTQGPFLLGEQFSAADVYVGSQLRWGLVTEALTPDPTVERYLRRLDERPAAKRAASLDLALAEELRPGGY